MNELEKMSSVQEKSQLIGEFLHWLMLEKGIQLTVRHVHSDGCYEPHDCEKHTCSAKLFHRRCTRKRELSCGCSDNALIPVCIGTEKLLAEFFGIDLGEAEQERRALLASLREPVRAGK